MLDKFRGWLSLGQSAGKFIDEVGKIVMPEGYSLFQGLRKAAWIFLYSMVVTAVLPAVREYVSDPAHYYNALVAAGIVASPSLLVAGAELVRNAAKFYGAVKK